MKYYKGLPWEYKRLKEINGCMITKFRDKMTDKISYIVQDLHSNCVIIPTVGEFNTLAEARECARKVKR